MSDLRLLAVTLSGGFLFLGGIILRETFWDNSPGNLLLAVGLIALLAPIVTACLHGLRHFFCWFNAWDPFPQSQNPPSDRDKESK